MAPWHRQPSYCHEGNPGPGRCFLLRTAPLGAVFLRSSALNPAQCFPIGWEQQVRDEKPPGAPEDMESRWQEHKKKCGAF